MDRFFGRSVAGTDQVAPQTKLWPSDTLGSIARVNTSESRLSNHSNHSFHRPRPAPPPPIPSIPYDSVSRSTTPEKGLAVQQQHRAQRRVASNSSLPRSPHALSFTRSHDDDAAAWRPSTDGPRDDRNEALLAYADPSQRSLKSSRPSTANRSRQNSKASEGRPSNVTSYSLYPQPNPPVTKPLPPLPPLPARNPLRVSSRPGSKDASDATTSSAEISRFSQSSHTTSSVDHLSNGTSPPSASQPFHPPTIRESVFMSSLPLAHGASAVKVVPWKLLTSDDKHAKSGKDQTVFFFDVTTSSTTLASKHGNNIIKVWSVGSGSIQNVIKISCYTTAQARSREYFVRSHAILSEPSTLIAIAVGFGDELEIWNWAKKKKLQTIEQAERWAAVRSNVYESAWSPLVTYRGDRDTLDLYSVTPHSKKPFKKSRTINLRNAGLPVLPKYPELAFSATSPILVAASGPRPPRLGHPPPERETLLVAWDIQDPDSNSPNLVSDTPYKVVAPWQHSELDTALPSGLATYGSVAVSIWIPASYQVVPVPTQRGGQGFNLSPVAVPHRYVLVWDFSASSTRTFRIPNAVSCVSPDCRFIAYCDAAGAELGARGNLVILDALSGKRLWCWPDPDASSSATDTGSTKSGFEQLEDLTKVTEMAFSADGGFLFVGGTDGEIGVYEVRETVISVAMSSAGGGEERFSGGSGSMTGPIEFAKVR